jgi:hypothetical protein
MLHKWEMNVFSLCDCGKLQTVKHIAEFCPLKKYDGGVLGIHLSKIIVTEWLTNLDVRL